MKIMKVGLGTLLLLLVSFPAWSAPAEVAQTGQKTCYADSGGGAPIPCATISTSQDGKLQIGAEVFPRFHDNGDGTVTDDLTGLIWLKNANCFDRKNWAAALTAANTLKNGECGLSDGSRKSDWRLPNTLELKSLISYQHYRPTISNTAGTGQWTEAQPFIGIRSNSPYWSSTTYVAINNDHARSVSFASGSMYNMDKDELFYLWPVKGGQSASLEDSVILLPQTGQTICYAANGTEIACAGTGQDGEIRAGAVIPTPRFVDNTDGTLTDTLTDLIWLKNANCSQSVPNWTSFLGNITQLNTDGTMPPYGTDCGDTSNGGSHQTDWRLPNVNELLSLADLSDEKLMILSLRDLSTGLQYDDYWSGTTYTTDDDYFTYPLAWQVSPGSNAKITSKYNSALTWAVRGGQSRTFYNLRISKAGTGSGAVTSNPVGIDCRDDCSQSFNDSEMVTLTATSDSGSFFAGWSGQCTGSNFNTTVATDSIKNCIATFTESFRIPATPTAVPQTGQKTIYEPGDDGNIRSGIASPTPRFLDNKNGTVKDNLTGLTWLKNAGCFTQQQWSAALITASTLKQGDCALTDGSAEGDWRLPNIRELRSLINAQYVNPALSNTLGIAHYSNGDPFSGVRADLYWSATTSAHNTDRSWYIDFTTGHASQYPKEHSYSVWPVKDGQSGSLADSPILLPQTGQKTSYANRDDGALQTGIVSPSSRFTDNKDGTILDNLTGLIWLQNAYCSASTHLWQDARDEITKLNTDGTMKGTNCGDSSNNGSHQKDWRFPNVNELWSLIDFSADAPAMPFGHPFSNVQSYYYWTNTNTTSDAKFVELSDGRIYQAQRSGFSRCHVWPVRGGQADLFEKKSNILLMIVPAISGNGPKILR